MEENFKIIKEKSKELGLTSDSIVKVLELLKHAEIYQVDMYVSDGKLRMRKKVKPLTDKDKKILDELSGKKSKGGPFSKDIKDLFGKDFGDIFK